MAPRAKRIRKAAPSLSKPSSIRRVPRNPMAKYADYPEQIDEHPELARWAAAYCKAAKAGGHGVTFAGEGWPYEIEGTIRLISEVYAFNGWKRWLSWQVYHGPRGKGPWLILREFEEPEQWNGAKVFIQNPWDFAFSRLYMASEMTDVTFTIVKHGGKRFTAKEHLDLGRAIVDGMDYDYDRDSYRVILTRNPKKLVVRLWNPDFGEDEDGEPDEDGIVWCRR